MKKITIIIRSADERRCNALIGCCNFNDNFKIIVLRTTSPVKFRAKIIAGWVSKKSIFFLVT